MEVRLFSYGERLQMPDDWHEPSDGEFYIEGGGLGDVVVVIPAGAAHSAKFQQTLSSLGAKPSRRKSESESSEECRWDVGIKDMISFMGTEPFLQWLGVDTAAAKHALSQAEFIQEKKFSPKIGTWVDIYVFLPEDALVSDVMKLLVASSDLHLRTSARGRFAFADHVLRESAQKYCLDVSQLGVEANVRLAPRDPLYILPFKQHHFLDLPTNGFVLDSRMAHYSPNMMSSTQHTPDEILDYLRSLFPAELGKKGFVSIKEMADRLLHHMVEGAVSTLEGQTALGK